MGEKDFNDYYYKNIDLNETTFYEQLIITKNNIVNREIEIAARENENDTTQTSGRENENDEYSIANLCYYKDTIIETDQGKCKIQELSINNNTINGKNIITITKTITPDNNLICFSKNSLGPNKPDADLIVTGIHKILYNNNLIEAYKFLNTNNIYLVKNNNQPVYNILLNTYDIIKANNVFAETVDPNNIYAKILSRVGNLENRKKLFKMVNNCHNNDMLKSVSKIVRLYSH